MCVLSPGCLVSAFIQNVSALVGCWLAGECDTIKKMCCFQGMLNEALFQWLQAVQQEKVSMVW